VFSVTADTEGDDGGDRLRSRRDGDPGGVDQRRPHHHPFARLAGHGYGTYECVFVTIHKSKCLGFLSIVGYFY